MARQAAEHRDEPTILGLAVFGDGLVLLADGEFELAQAELDAITTGGTAVHAAVAGIRAWMTSRPPRWRRWSAWPTSSGSMRAR